MMPEVTADFLRYRLQELGSPEKALAQSRFFKTGKGICRE